MDRTFYAKENPGSKVTKTSGLLLKMLKKDAKNDYASEESKAGTILFSIFLICLSN